MPGWGLICTQNHASAAGRTHKGIDSNQHTLLYHHSHPAFSTREGLELLILLAQPSRNLYVKMLGCGGGRFSNESGSDQMTVAIA